MNWDETNFMVHLYKQEFIRIHATYDAKNPTAESVIALSALRKACRELGTYRHKLNVDRLIRNIRPATSELNNGS